MNSWPGPTTDLNLSSAPPAPRPPAKIFRRSALIMPDRPEASFSLLHFLGWLHLRLLVLLALLTIGCGGSFEEARMAGVAARADGAEQRPSRVDCQALDTEQRVWGATAKGTAVAAGGAAVTPLIEEVRESKAGRIAVVGTAAGMAMVSAFSVAMQEGTSATWARECAE